jgi:NAD(P)-dependent dehydrogenase (short-subunit alcohol dehydrogenase family)
VKLTENLSAEVRRHGVRVFAFHPGLMPIGLSEKTVNVQADPDTPADRAIAWVRNEIAAGRAVWPERAASFIAALATGQADGLSGRYLTVFDDLPTLVAQANDLGDAAYPARTRTLVERATPMTWTGSLPPWRVAVGGNTAGRPSMAKRLRHPTVKL